MESQADWLEWLTKAFLPRTPRVWIRRHRNRRMFEQYVRPTDVFLVGHPKSGNTWLAYMLANLLSKDTGSAVTLANIKAYVPPVHGKDHRIREFLYLPNPRIFREEYPVHADLYPKTIYLLRDPRAVLISLYHMYRVECNDPDLPITIFTDDYLTKRGCFQRWNRGLIRWDRQVKTWTEQASRNPRVMIIRYEDMVQDRRKVLEGVAVFAGIPCDANQLALAHERSSFEAMQKEEDQYGAEAYPGELAKRGRFIRRGKTDGWRQEMPEELIQQLEREFGPTMRSVGYL